MAATPPLDKDFAADMAPLMAVLAAVDKPKPHDVEARRRLYAAMATPGLPATPDDVEHSVVCIPTPDGAKVRLLCYRKKGAAPGPAVIHMHGGGLIALSADVYMSSVCSHVAATGVQFFSVDYRLAPEHPYPLPLEDCWAALQWVVGNAPHLGVDVARLGVMGDSAGGNLAAALAILARDRGLSPPLKRQLLVYPMLDDRTTAGADAAPFCIWDPDDNLTAWTAYLGDKAGGDDVPATAAPARVGDATGLPPLYMDVGQLDLFADEDHGYAARFLAAKIETEFHCYSGLPHGFDRFAPGHAVSRAVEENRNRQLRRLYD